jgi:membrane protease YdiL (CAAX protease family)
MFERTSAGIPQKLFILIVAALAFAVKFGPSEWVLKHGFEALGRPPYAGPPAVLQHALLYSTATAFACLVGWLLLSAVKLLPPIALGRGRRPLLWGFLGAVIAIALTLAFFEVTGLAKLHYIPPKPWILAGNLFSNFYEEFIFRGFLLVALSAVFGFWPAALITSAAFGLVHDQYPLTVQGLVAAGGLVFAIAMKQAQTLWAPFLAHMGLDVVVDSLVG